MRLNITIEAVSDNIGSC